MTFLKVSERTRRSVYDVALGKLVALDKSRTTITKPQAPSIGSELSGMVMHPVSPHKISAKMAGKQAPLPKKTVAFMQKCPVTWQMWMWL